MYCFILALGYSSFSGSIALQELPPSYHVLIAIGTSYHFHLKISLPHIKNIDMLKSFDYCGFSL